MYRTHSRAANTFHLPKLIFDLHDIQRNSFPSYLFKKKNLTPCMRAQCLRGSTCVQISYDTSL